MESRSRNTSWMLVGLGLAGLTLASCAQPTSTPSSESAPAAAPAEPATEPAEEPAVEPATEPAAEPTPEAAPANDPAAAAAPAAEIQLAQVEVEEPADPYAVPEGTADELLQFITKVQSVRPTAATREAQMDHLQKMAGAINTAADRVLAGEATDDQAQSAAMVKLHALMLLNRLGVEENLDKANAFLETLQKDEREPLRQLARRQRMMFQAMQIDELDEAERTKLIEEILAYFKEREKIDREEMQLIVQLGNALESAEADAAAAEFYEAVIPLLKASENESIAEYAKKYEGVVRRLRLQGNQLELEGTLLDGQKLDWASYRGKVVLVDFWATWCGPCVAEMPNIKENYERYHDRGFDVIGISLDDDRKAVEDFIEQKEIPWPIMYSDAEGDAGWENPMATRYGITGIPTVILVDQQGKVVSLRVRGEKLGEELAKLLGPVEEAAAEKQ